MSDKISIKELLKGVEVEWKSVLEIIEDKFWIMPATPKCNENEKIPYITSKNIKNGHINFEKVSYISYSDYLEISHNRPIVAGDILISMIGTIGEVAKVKEQDLEFYGQNMYLIRLNNKLVSSDYFLYFFDSPKMKNHFASVKNNSGQGYLKAKDIDNLLVPIPPLHIQNEIVRILDNFTELTAELTARKKQYNYYRDKLLTFEGGEVEFKPLGEVANIYDGTHQTPKYISSGIPFVSVQNIKNIYATEKYISKEDFEKYKYKPQKNDLFMTRMGEIGTCAVVENDNPLAYYVTLALIRVNQKYIIPKFLKYIIESSIGKVELYKRTLIKAAPIKINLGEIGKIIIPIPSLKEQERIVSILDKFDTLTSSISEGLPKEIELRKQQYEYYRDLLLTFPKKAEELPA
ncbi:restriction endonuclease subunit S [Rickettsiales bacterium LUAb2]